MKKYNLPGIAIDLVMAFILLLFATIASAQPYTAPGYAYQDTPPTLAELKNTPTQKPVKVLGVFKTNRQASTALTAYGIAAMTVGSYLQGKASHHIQYHHSTGGWNDNYHVTRGAGLGLQVSGAAAYGGGFALRDRKYKHSVLGAIGEGLLLFAYNTIVSQAAYRFMPTKYPE